MFMSPSTSYCAPLGYAQEHTTKYKTKQSKIFSEPNALAYFAARTNKEFGEVDTSMAKFPHESPHKTWWGKLA